MPLYKVKIFQNIISIPLFVVKIKSPILILLIIISQSIISQNLHHQMFSSQGTGVELSNGFYVSKTIGQQSIIGSSKIKTIAII